MFPYPRIQASSAQSNIKKEYGIAVILFFKDVSKVDENQIASIIKNEFHDYPVETINVIQKPEIKALLIKLETQDSLVSKFINAYKVETQNSSILVPKSIKKYEITVEGRKTLEKLGVWKIVTKDLEYKNMCILRNEYILN
jgi:hypothetical protein